MATHCKNCGSTSLKIKSILMCDTYVEIIRICVCGTEIRTRMPKDEYFGLVNWALN